MKKRIAKLIGLFFIILGIMFPTIKVQKEEIIESQNKKELEKKEEGNSFFALLEIPKIGLKKELFPVSDKENNVDKNIYLHPKSILPDNKSSNVIILGHSGYGSSAHFKNLYKIHTSDVVNLEYEDKIYEYEIKEIEIQKKSGTLSLKKEYKDMITLITCTKNDNFSQTIYYGMLKNVQKR